MARVKVKSTKSNDQPPREAPTFEEQFKNVATNLHHLATTAHIQNEEDIERGIIAVAGLAMGMWLELHRIADVLEHATEPLAALIAEQECRA
jgi:hypothetical protein